MGVLFSTTRTPIGLDIGSRTIKAAQLSLGRGRSSRPRLEAAVVLERQSPGEAMSEAEARRLRTVLERRGFTGREVVAVVPPEALMTSVLELPPRDSGAPLSAIAKAEMARTHRVDAGAMEAAYWELPEANAAHNKHGTPVMVAGCLHEASEAMLDVLEAPGLDVLAIDLEGCALCRATRRSTLSTGTLVAVIDIGWRGVNFVLLYDDIVVYERALEGTGIQTLGEMVQQEHPLPLPVIEYLLREVGFASDRTDIQPEDSRLVDKLRAPLDQHFASLCQELQLSVSYATHQYPNVPLDRLLISGGGAMIRGLGEHLSEQLDLPVDVLAPASICDVPAGGLDEGGETSLSVAVGLAMYPWKEGA